MKDYGFCYVADCDPYIDEAMGSIASLRAHMPDVPIAFVTHEHLFRRGTPVTDWVKLEQKREGPIVKIDALLAPYEHVIFLDTDTLIIGNLVGVFALLDRFDFASVPEPNARPDRGLDSGVPLFFPEPNSGFFAFRKSPAVRNLFEAWLKEYDILQQTKGVTTDQPALRIALWKNNSVRHLTLGSEFNLIPHTNSGVSGAVAVLHDRSPERVRLAATINRHLEPRAIVLGFGPIFGFSTRRGWVRQFARLTWNFLRMFVRPNLAEQRGYPVIWWREGID